MTDNHQRRAAIVPLGSAPDYFPETFQIDRLGLAIRSAIDDTLVMGNTATKTGTRNETMTTQTSDLQVAQTIIAQMGGTRRLSLMVGASLFAGDDSSAMFSFKGSRKMNKCRVTLDASDTYTVEFFKFSPSKLTCPVVEEISGVYAEMLVDIFESRTGLYLSF